MASIFDGHALPAPRDLDLIPNKVNADICAHPDDFPLDAPWMTLLHAKGQSQRASPAWLERRFALDLAQGMDALELAGLCWCMGLLGHGSSHARFKILTSLAPKAASIAFDDGASRDIFAKLAVDFGSAAVDWEAPSSMSLRGWSARISDRAMEAATRESYASLAIHCAHIAKNGLPEILRQAIFSPVENLEFSQEPSLAVHRAAAFPALYFALVASKARGLAGTWLEGSGRELLAGCAGSCSAQKYMALVQAWEAEAPEQMRLAGAGLVRALRLHSNVPKALASSQALFGMISSRADVTLDFFKGALGADADLSSLECMEELFVAMGPSAQASSALARVAMAFLKVSPSPLSRASPQAAALIWRSHLADAPVSKKSQPGFFHRHVILARHFPLREFEARSLAHIDEKVVSKAEQLLISQSARSGSAALPSAKGPRL